MGGATALLLICGAIAWKVYKMVIRHKQRYLINKAYREAKKRRKTEVIKRGRGSPLYLIP